MADKKISELTALTSVTDTDKFAIVDDSATETKHVVRDDIFGQGLSSSDSPTFVAGTFTGDLAVDTDTLFVDASADRVGINTTSPATTLDVRAALAGIQIRSTTNQADLYFSSPNTTENRIFFGDTDDFDVGSIKYDHSTNKMTVTVNTISALAIDSGGILNFGTHSAIGAETVTGYITVKDSGGTSRKLAVVS